MKSRMIFGLQYFHQSETGSYSREVSNDVSEGKNWLTCKKKNS